MVTIFPGIIFVGFLFGYFFLLPLPYAPPTATPLPFNVAPNAPNAWPYFLSRAPYFSLDSNYIRALCGNVASQT